MIKVINIKEGMPYPDIAVYDLEKEIEMCKIQNINAIIAIHGYGSKGYGGAIKKETMLKLQELKNKKNIYNFIKGEEWGSTNSELNELKKQEPELILHPLLVNLNSGVTVIWIKHQ